MNFSVRMRDRICTDERVVIDWGSAFSCGCVSFLPQCPRGLLERERGQRGNIDRNGNDSPRQCLSLKRSSDHHPGIHEKGKFINVPKCIVLMLIYNKQVWMTVLMSHPSRPSRNRAGMLGLAVLPSVIISRYWLSLSSALSAIKTALPPAPSTCRAFCTKEQPLECTQKQRKKW